MKPSTKKALIIVGIVILMFIGYLILKPTTTNYFDKIDIPPTSSVTNRTGISYLDTIVHTGLNILEIDTVFININKLSKDTKPDNSEDNIELLALLQAGENNTFSLSVNDNESRYEYIKIISHELIHLRDYYNKDLILFDNYGVIYKDKEWEDGRTVPYARRPWEIEAELQGRILATKIKDKLYPKE